MQRINKPKPVVTIYRGGRKATHLWVFGLSFLMLTGAAALFYWAVARTPDNPPSNPDADAQSVIDTQQQKIAFLEQKNDELARELALVKRADRIDTKANEKLMQNLTEREREVQDVKERLSVCETLIAADEGKEGVRVHHFSLLGSPEPRLYLFTLSLTNTPSQQKSVKGTVQIQAQGKLRGENKTLEWSQIAPKDAPKLDFDFQYFVRLEGRFQLPLEFEPETLIVRVKPTTAGAKSVQENLSWNTIEKRASSNVGQK